MDGVLNLFQLLSHLENGDFSSEILFFLGFFLFFIQSAIFYLAITKHNPNDGFRKNIFKNSRIYIIFQIANDLIAI